jgi:uncharacterized protein (TIGR03790 family)
MRIGPAIRVVLTCVALDVACGDALAIDPSGVLVVYNTYDPDPNDGLPSEGQQIAEYYSGVYGLAPQQLLGLNLVDAATTISSADYLTKIRQPVLGALTPATNVIVTTRGMPLKVQVGVSNPTTYTDLYGNFNTIVNWKGASSLESELTRIDYIGDISTPEKTITSQQMMGDQSYQFTSPPFSFTHYTNNPYYGATSSFSQITYGTRLTSRLDGFTVGDVTAAIDRAQNAFVGPNNTTGGPFHFVVDADPSKTYASPMTNLVTNVLQPGGLPVTYDNTGAFVSTALGPVLGYSSHGANQASTPGFNGDPELGPVGSYIATSLNFTLANGAVFNSWESFNAESFAFAANHGNQGLLAEWLAKGGTAAVGNVTEPGASINTVFNEDKLFDMLLEGKTFAEAAWSAARQLSWVGTVVGDPLMTWKQLLPGDANVDGVVDMGDLAAMGPYWGRWCGGGGYGWTQGDLNGDGFVDMADLAMVSSSWGQTSNWAALPANLTDPLGSQMAMALYASMQQIPNIPEPSSVALMAIGVASLSAYGWRRRRAGRPVKKCAT